MREVTILIDGRGWIAANPELQSAAIKALAAYEGEIFGVRPDLVTVIVERDRAEAVVRVPAELDDGVWIEAVRLRYMHIVQAERARLVASTQAALEANAAKQSKQDAARAAQRRAAIGDDWGGLVK